jgi:hypothetical protein
MMVMTIAQYEAFAANSATFSSWGNGWSSLMQTLPTLGVLFAYLATYLIEDVLPLHWSISARNAFALMPVAGAAYGIIALVHPVGWITSVLLFVAGMCCFQEGPLSGDVTRLTKLRSDEAQAAMTVIFTYGQAVCAFFIPSLIGWAFGQLDGGLGYLAVVGIVVGLLGMVVVGPPAKDDDTEEAAEARRRQRSTIPRKYLWLGMFTNLISVSAIVPLFLGMSQNLVDHGFPAREPWWLWGASAMGIPAGLALSALWAPVVTKLRNGDCGMLWSALNLVIVDFAALGLDLLHGIAWFVALCLALMLIVFAANSFEMSLKARMIGTSRAAGSLLSLARRGGAQASWYLANRLTLYFKVSIGHHVLQAVDLQPLFGITALIMTLILIRGLISSRTKHHAKGRRSRHRGRRKPVLFTPAEAASS